MFCKQLFFLICQALSCFCVFYNRPNTTRTTPPGIAEYRSALTLDWLAAEDSRQRELVKAYETSPAPPARVIATECMIYAKPASGKVGRLMLELLKNLEGDEGILMTEMIQALVRSKLLVETSMLEAEPDLEALVKTPGVMMGEPHSTFPRILAMAWMAAGDTSLIKKHGWCPLKRITKYLSITRPAQIAKHMRSIDPVIARARYLIEEFVQHVTPIHVYSDKNHFDFGKKDQPDKKLASSLKDKGLQIKRPLRTTYTSTKSMTIKREQTLGLPISTDVEEPDENIPVRILKNNQDHKQKSYIRPTDNSDLGSGQVGNSALLNEMSLLLLWMSIVLL